MDMVTRDEEDPFLAADELALPDLMKTTTTRRSVEHCTPHADGAWLNELGWAQ